MRLILLWTLALLLAAPANATPAETVAETVTRWGLSGVWMQDCRQPFTREAGQVTVSARPDGTAFIHTIFGAQDTMMTITSARITGAGLLEIVGAFESDPDHPYESTIEKAPDGRMHTAMVRRHDGTVLARDGHYVQNGTPTRWWSRCSERTTAALR